MRRSFDRLVFFGLGVGCTIAVAAAAAVADTDRFYEKLDVLAEVLGHIHSQYVDRVDSQKLLYGAARGATETLDEHSVFFEPENYRELLESTEGEFGGVGVEVRSADGTASGDVQIVEVSKNSPAQRAGIVSGDMIVSVDGTPIRFGQAARRLKGAVGGKIVLGVRRPGRDRVWSYTLVRQWIRVSPLVHRHFGGGLHYVHMKMFPRRVAGDLDDLLRRQLPRALVLDLRDNPGGLFDEAVEVCDLFLKRGIIVTATGRDGRGIEEQEARATAAHGRLPIAVLIDEGSASAAEVVAGALKDRKRARLFGARSYGKGTVQTVIDLSDGSGLKLTIARYRTPSGADIEGQGITPHEIFDSAARQPYEDAALAAARRWLRKQL